MDSKSSTSSMYLDPEINKFGVYVIQIQGIKSPINVQIFDPFENEISKSTYRDDSIEEKFVINERGVYTMTINNTTSTEVYVTHAFGYLSGEFIFSVGLMCFYIMLVGPGGILACSVFLVKSRRSNN